MDELGRTTLANKSVGGTHAFSPVRAALSNHVHMAVDCHDYVYGTKKLVGRYN